ncbi:reverse transcriptase domain-containing protein [Tanacetum coccineum]
MSAGRLMKPRGTMLRWRNWPCHYCTCHEGFEAHPIKVISDQPIKHILSKVQVSGKLAKYSIELGSYNITYEPRNAIKGQVLADFLSEAPVGTKPEGSSAGLVLISPSGMEFTYALSLNFTRTNNKVEYEALVAGLRLAAKMQVQAIDVKDGDRRDCGERIGNWMTPIIKCLEEGVWPNDKNEAKAFIMKINQYVMEGGVLFKKGYVVPMMRCVGPLQANYVIREIHMGACGMHSGTRSVVAKVIRRGYYWPTMHIDAGMNILSPLPESIRKVKFVIVAIDYFTKWIKAKSLARITEKEGSEAVIPAEIGMPTHRTMMIREDENEDELHRNMDLLDECVFRRIEASRVEDQGKLGSKWEGPYRITKAY